MTRVTAASMAALCISAITEAELLVRLAKRPAAKRLPLAVREFLKRVDVLPWDSSAAQHYATIHAEMKAKGRPLAPLRACRTWGGEKRICRAPQMGEEAKRRQLLVQTEAFEAMVVVSRRGRLPSRVIFRILWKPAIHPSNPSSNAAAPKATGSLRRCLARERVSFITNCSPLIISL